MSRTSRLRKFYAAVTGGDLPDTVADETTRAELRESKFVLPRISVRCEKENGEQTADIVANAVSLIVEGGKIFYFEVACTSDTMAHAFAGALSDDRVNASWKVHWHEKDAEWDAIKPPDAPAIRDIRLSVSGMEGKHLHHMAALDKSGGFLLADSDATLWRKLRRAMTAPTLGEWGEVLMPRILRSGVVARCKTFGLPEGTGAYVIPPDAQSIFDRLVSEHVCAIGGLPARRSA